MGVEIGGSLDPGWDRCQMWDEMGRKLGLGMCRFGRSWDEVGRGAGLVSDLGFDLGQGRVPGLVGWGARTSVGQVAGLKH